MNDAEVRELTMKLAFDVVVDLAKARGIDCPLALIFQTEIDHITKVSGDWNPEHGNNDARDIAVTFEPVIRYIFGIAHNVVTARELGYPIVLAAQVQVGDYQYHYTNVTSEWNKDRGGQIRSVVNDYLKAA